MSTWQAVKTITLEAAGNLAGSQFHAVTINSNGQVELTDNGTDIVVGILAEETGPTSAGDAVTVVQIAGGGTALVEAQGNISPGEILVPTTTNQPAVYGRARGHDAGIDSGIFANQMGFGVAIDESTGNGQVIRFKIMGVGGPHSA